MQLSKTIIPYADTYSQVFTRSRNRVEFIADFPKNDNTMIVYPIEVLLIVLSLLYFENY